MKTYTDVTITRARELAKRSTRHGYGHEMDTERSWSWCPECQAKVEGYHLVWAKPGERVKAVRAAVVDHLISGECPKHPEVL